MAVKLKAGVAGFGKSAKVFHLPFITTMPEFELTTILERKNKEAKHIYPSVNVVTSIDELVADKETDIIIVTTPNDSHFEYASKALQAGKHVILEKPFTETTEEGRELVRIARDSGKILSVYQNRRYVSDYLTIKDLLKENLLGDVHEFNATYDRYRPQAIPGAWREAPKAGSGILYDLGPHLIDQVLSLFGNPLTITADIRLQRPHSKVDDYFNIWLDYGSMKAILHAGMLVREQGPRYMIQGMNGSFIKYGEDPQEEKLKAGELPVGDDWGREPESFHGLLHTEINGEVLKRNIPSRKGNYGGYYKNVYNTIVNNATLQEKPEHGYNTIRIIELAFESSRTKRTLDCTGLM
jgi:predicted dehydrogenase